ncbi:MAG: DNA-3-methyladenine glycosylase I [Planctomycetes bacterium]|nr:DNA-3-methyladenine glycosylase I [Planctomycetota bacterium]
MTAEKKRCGWVDLASDLYVAYHDDEWGVPVRDDRTLFEFLLLEGAQAGLSWITILRKREAYRAAFAEFDPERVARFTRRDEARLLENPGIVRNRLKVGSAAINAKAFLGVQEEFGSFADWLWGHVDGRPLRTRRASLADVPATTALSDLVAKRLKKRGFKFVGSTIVYAYLQAVGVVDDHEVACFRGGELGR